MRVLTPAQVHLPRQVSPLISYTLPSIPPPTTWMTRTSFHAPISTCPVSFRLHPLLAGSPSFPRRIEFALLRTASSPPAAPHPASRQRSYLRLRGHGLPRHGLSPCYVYAFTGALGAAPGRASPGHADALPRYLNAVELTPSPSMGERAKRKGPWDRGENVDLCPDICASFPSFGLLPPPYPPPARGRALISTTLPGHLHFTRGIEIVKRAPSP